MSDPQVDEKVLHYLRRHAGTPFRKCDLGAALRMQRSTLSSVLDALTYKDPLLSEDEHGRVVYLRKSAVGG